MYYSGNRHRGNGRKGGSPFGGRPNSNSNRGKSKKTIDPQRFVNQAVMQAKVEKHRPRRQFRHFAFDPRMHKAIIAKGYTEPTPIQDKAIPHILAGRDVVGIANTGTGKTASFVLPIINRLLADPDRLALVVTPTRELATQIDEEFRSFAKSFDMRSAVCVGGISKGPQLKALRAKPQLIVGTPGRLKDFVTSRDLKLKGCSTFVLDEADRMLDMGFINDMKFLMGHLPDERQSLCFSATMTSEVEKIVEKLLLEPVTVSVRTTLNSAHIEQSVVRTTAPGDKLEQLQQMLGNPEWNKVLIFGETKFGVQRLSEKLEKRGIKATAIHGNKNQNQRQRALEAFKRGTIDVLVATDVAARGLDIDDVSHVVNYDPPQEYDDYIHRIGRTGRAGKAGGAGTFVGK